MNINKYQEIEISEVDFLPLLKWCLLKFESDPLSRIYERKWRGFISNDRADSWQGISL